MKHLDRRKWLVFGLAGVLVVIGVGATVTLSLSLPAAAFGAIVLVAIGVAFMLRPVTVLLGLWIFALVQPTLAALTGRSSGPGTALNLVDHPIIAVLVICAALVWAARNPSIRPSIWLPALGFTSAGILSAVFHDVGLAPMALGGWSSVKLWVLLFVTTQVTWSSRDIERFERILRWSVYAVVVGVLLNAAAPATFTRVLSTNVDEPVVRAGLPSLQSFFIHPSALASFSGVGVAIYLARVLRGGHPRDQRLLLLCVACGLVSLKLKIVLVLGAVLSSAVLAAPRTTARRLRGLVLAGVVVLGLVGSGVLAEVVGTQLSKYLDSDETIRAQLYEASFAMGRANFPLGEGFGRFGSGAATRYYSPVYGEYGLSGQGGLKEGAAIAAHDTTWPTVLGETGYLGLAFFAGGVLMLFLTALRRARAAPAGVAPRWLDLAGVTLLGGLLAESIGKSSFFKLHTMLTVALLVGASWSLASRCRSVARPVDAKKEPAPRNAPVRGLR